MQKSLLIFIFILKYTYSKINEPCLLLYTCNIKKAFEMRRKYFKTIRIKALRFVIGAVFTESKLVFER